jgi:hypothetical protein
MTDFNEVKLFGDTSLSDVFQQIHKNNKKIDKQIDGLVNALKPLINSAGEAVMVMPTVKDLIDVNVKNNDQLVKMAGIAQRAMSSANTNSSDSLFDPDEMTALIEEHKATQIEGNNLLEQGQKIKGQIEA